MQKTPVKYGIQGGRGSFNEEMLLDYIQNNSIKNYKIKYLYTTEKVLKQLELGNIDFGLFAMHNSRGGIVDESLKAIAKHIFEVEAEPSIVIRHFLMKLPDVPVGKIKTIMAHPQVLKQCKENLSRLYPNLKQTSGKGDLIDTAEAGKALSKGKIDKSIAILGPKSPSDLYGLEIIAENLQDDKNNVTSFLLVKK